MPQTPESNPAPAAQAQISFRQALQVWIEIAVLSFGGPAGQIAVMHRLLVEQRRWISENRFLHALNYTMLLPGPEAQQLATYTGWLLHRTLGGLTAGLLFILPGFVSILVLSILYAEYQQLGVVQAFFYGLKPAVMAVVAEAVFRIGSRVLKNRLMIAFSALAFVAIFFFNVPFPWIVILAGVSGYFGGWFRPDLFVVLEGHVIDEDESAVIADSAVQRELPSWRRSLALLAFILVIWLGPVVWLYFNLGPDNVFTQIGMFFSQAAVVTFGGAYAVLAYIAQEAVSTFGWLQPGEMLDGLGMAETTPGPLIQVVQFVGFMGAYRNPGSLTPLMAGFLGSLLTTWVTFAPCFLWIFLGAPYIERLRGNRALTAAFSAITASVVGVILNLAIWFSLNTLFSDLSLVEWGPASFIWPLWESVDWAALVIALAAFWALFRLKWSMIAVLAGSALIGLVYYLLFLG